MVERSPLQLEEQQRRLDRGLLLLHSLQQRAVGRVGGVGGEAQRRVVAGATDEFVNRGELAHRLAQAIPIKVAKLSSVALGERLGARERVRHPRLDAVLALAVDERLEVPCGRVELGVARLGGGCGGHRRQLRPSRRGAWRGATVPGMVASEQPTRTRLELRRPVLLALALGISALGLGGSPSALMAAASHTPRPPSRAHAKPHHKAPAPPEVTLAGSLAGPSAQVTMPPVGLSMEYSVMAQDLGAGACPPPALVTELLQLGSPPLALAGDTQDMTAPSGGPAELPVSWQTATLYPLPANFWSQLHCLLSATKDPLTAGINVKSGSLSWAQQIAAGAQSAATNGLEFSLGNEPDLYSLPNYASLAKPQAGEEAAAAQIYLQIATYMQQALGGAPVIGPELARPAHWQAQLPHVIEALHARTVGVHLYPLSGCVTPRAVTVGGLLSERAADAPHRLAWVVADANAAHLPAIISEANSASCAGQTGTSDSPAAAVWAVRFVLVALKTGFREVRFHFSGGPYDPFLVRGEELIERPLESALEAIGHWLPVGASLQSVAGVRGLRATRIGTPGGGTLLMLDNEHSQAQTVVLRSSHGVQLEALSAARAGVQTTRLSPTHDRIKVMVAANSVVAISATT